MSWKNIMKLDPEGEYELREMQQRRKEKSESYDKPPRNQKAVLGGKDKCYVRRCNAIRCKHNSAFKNKNERLPNCTLREIDVDNNGECEMFETELSNLFEEA